jgi:Holliday junction resolvase RusA-like endonuclease
MTTLRLPFPVSANRMYRRSGNRIHISTEYQKWKAEADGYFLQQKREAKPVKGRFLYHYTIDERRRAVARDGDNRGKVLLDFAQRVGLIDDDKLANGGSWNWGPVDGCILTISEV